MEDQTHRLLAVNLNSYGPYRDLAYRHLQSIGVSHVEERLPAVGETGAFQSRLTEHGLQLSSLICPCRLSDPSDDVSVSFATAAELGVTLLFMSAQSGGMTFGEACAELKRRARLAAGWGLTLSLETHPTLAHSAGLARHTLSTVGEPNLGWNLDTANLYYYNAGIDAVVETAEGVDLVRSVHLKDTTGGFQEWNFPALGEGVVDFAAIIGLLERHGFRGPYTLEIEGVEGEELSQEAVLERVRVSVERARGWLA